MNEGYALFDKMVSVLEGANVYKKASGSAPFPSSKGTVDLFRSSDWERVIPRQIGRSKLFSGWLLTPERGCAA